MISEELEKPLKEAEFKHPIINELLKLRLLSIVWG
jgi:hypothetical protein